MKKDIRKHIQYFVTAAAAAALVFSGWNITLTADTMSADKDEVLAIDPSGGEEGYSAVLYNSTNGLPTSEANAIEETAEGFIWIGSYSGLIRYDGNTFERADSTTGIASVVSLFVDRDNRLWVGTNDSGAAVIEQGEQKMYNKAEGLKSSSVRCITEDNSGNIYLGTARGLSIIDGEDNVISVEDERLADQYIRRMENGSGIIYGVTQDGAVFTLKGTEVLSYVDEEALGIPHVRTIIPDNKKLGYVYLGTEASEVYYGRPTSNGMTDVTVIDVSPLNYVNEIELFDDQIWFCADNGIGILKDGTFSLLENVPMYNSIEHIMTDYSGNVWFTSSRQGVMKIVPNQFSDVFERFELPDMVVNSTCKYNEHLMIGADSGLTIVDDNVVLESFPIEKTVTASGEDLGINDLLKLLGTSRIRSIQRDSKNRLWFATYSNRGLVCYDNGSVTCYTVDDGMSSDRIRTSFELADGSILAPCSGGGVVGIKDDKIVAVYNADTGLSNADVLSVTQADNGDLVFGTDGDGIYIVSGTDLIHVNTEDGLLSDVVMRIKKDSDHHVFWIVTSNSIAYMTEDYKVTSISKFPYSNNFDLYENSKGDMWILSSNGIYVVPADELLENGDVIVPVFYGRDNGLPCIATANSYSELTRDGDLFISGTNGVAKVNIEVPFEDVTDLKMAVPYVEADGTYIYADEETGIITVPSSTRKLTIHSFVYNYSLLNPQVTYYLDGFEELETTVKRSELAPVNYTNLKGGEYKFIMRLRDAMGRGGKEMSVTIIKEKAIYEQLWFIILMVILGIGLAALVIMYFVRRRTKILEKKMAENKALIHEMTEAFAKVIDMKDRYTNGHSMRVAEYTAMLARELGYDEETVEKYYNIALLHDIGKIGIPPEVLNKPGKLTDEEFKIIKSHSSLGYRALKDISIMPDLAIGAGAHHERPDGKGYPKGLKGDEIPRVAQIIAVADTFDAMYSNRPYRNRMNFEKVVSIIKEVSGTQLTSDVVDAFLRLVEKGEFRDPNDTGGGSTEDIDNIHKKFDSESSAEKKKTETVKAEEKKPEKAEA